MTDIEIGEVGYQKKQQGELQRDLKIDALDDHSFVQRNSSYSAEPKLVFEAYPEIKKMFIRRVYQILTIQLIVTFGIMFLIHRHANLTRVEVEAPGADNQDDPLLQPQMARPAYESSASFPLLLWGNFAMIFGSLIALHVFAKRYPWNLALLGVFTVSESIMLGISVVDIEFGILFEAFVITISLFIGLSLYTILSKDDYSWMGSYLFTGLWVMIFGSILHVVFGLGGDGFDLLYSWGGAALFSGFVIFDTWRLHYKLRTDEYITATVTLYLDVLNLFINILRILSKKK
eukprot:TRINITY_DN14522_c0_g1_i1.p1 TRINITY_DN14522_c0_g1~~TRINITY_DN14522_c0_g1_i1.p1  ORF type:complete len:289 (-),score=25.36 TRINITY_DN14522_c0_g1_i1:24-890(-)